MIASTDNNGQINFEPVFRRLNEELTAKEQSLSLVCAGGYVMQQKGYRATVDVDAFYKSNAEIEAAILKVGEEFGINKPDESWLNNSISNMNSEPPDEHCEVIYKFTNLTVSAVSITYLLGMKLISGRGQDIIDVATVLKHDNNKSPIELMSKLIDMKFEVDISDLLDAFELAFGMDWLEEFYIKNQNELRRYF
jgi:hypothetical protein